MRFPAPALEARAAIPPFLVLPDRATMSWKVKSVNRKPAVAIGRIAPVILPEAQSNSSSAPWRPATSPRCSPPHSPTTGAGILRVHAGDRPEQGHQKNRPSHIAILTPPLPPRYFRPRWNKNRSATLGSLGLFSGTMAVIGGIIGSGIFLNPAIVAARVGTAAAHPGRLDPRRRRGAARRLHLRRAGRAECRGSAADTPTCAMPSARCRHSSTPGPSCSSWRPVPSPRSPSPSPVTPARSSAFRSAAVPAAGRGGDRAAHRAQLPRGPSRRAGPRTSSPCSSSRRSRS